MKPAMGSVYSLDQITWRTGPSGPDPGGFNHITVLILRFGLSMTGLSNQCRPKSDAAERGIRPGSTLFALNAVISIKHSYTNAVSDQGLHCLRLIQHFYIHSIVKWTCRGEVQGKGFEYLGTIRYPKFIKLIQNVYGNKILNQTWVGPGVGPRVFSNPL